MKSAMVAAADGITSAIDGAARAVVGDVANMVAAFGKVNLSSQMDSVRAFEGATARMAVSMGRDLEAVRSQAEAVGASIGRRPKDVVAWADSVGKLTYSFQGALDSQKAFAGLAAMTGRSVDDYKGLATTLGTVGVSGGNAEKVIGKIVAQSEAMKSIGGAAALADEFDALGDSVTQFSDRSATGIAKVTGLLATLGQGLDAVAAKRVGQQAIGAITSDPRRWERFLGHHVLDEHGHVQDPAKVMREIYEKAQRRYGGNQEQLRNVLINNFGAELGSQMLYAGKHGGFQHMDALAGLAPSGKPQAALAGYLGTDAGRRDVAGADLDVSSRQLLGSSTKLGQAADALQRFASHNPLTSTAVTAGLSAGAATAMGSFTKSLANIMGGGGGGGIVGGLKGAAGIGGVLAAGAAGYALGSYADEKLGISDRIAGTGAHYREDADAGARADAQQKLKDLRAAGDRDARVHALERAGLGHGQALFVAEHEKGQYGAAAKAQADAIKDAVAAGIKSGMKDVKIVTRQDTPIEVTAAGGAHPSAGNQGGG